MVEKEPPPKYNEERDAVMGYVIPRFGLMSWELPILAIPMTELEAAAAAAEEDNGGKVYDMHHRWFARLLLSGKVQLNLIMRQSHPTLFGNSIILSYTPLPPHYSSNMSKITFSISILD